MSSHVFSVMKAYQMQLLVQGAVFEWDKKNPWVERGKDGRFGSGGSKTELSVEKADGDKDTGLFSKKELLKIVGHITGEKKVDTTEAEKVIDDIKKDTKNISVIDKISKVIEENKENLAAIAGAVAVLAAVSFICHRSSAFKTLKDFAKKNGINLDRLKLGKNVEKEIPGESSVHLDSIYGTIHELADEELKMVCKTNGISVPQVSMMTGGISQNNDYCTRGIYNKENNPIIERTESLIRGLNIDDLTYSEKPSILIMKKNGEVQVVVQGMTTNRTDYRGRRIRNAITFRMKDEGIKTENFARRLTKVFLDGDLDEIVEDCTNIVEDTKDAYFNLDTAKLISKVSTKVDNIKNNAKLIGRNISSTQNADEAFKELSKELTEFSLPWKDGVLLAVSKGITDSKKLKNAGVYRGIARL